MRRNITSALVAAAVSGAIASPVAATDNGYDYNNPFADADVSDCVRASASSGIDAFAFDGSAMPFTLKTADTPDACPQTPDKPCGDPVGAPHGCLRITTLQRLTVGGQSTYVNRGGGASRQPHVHVSSGDLAEAVTLRPFSVRKGNGRAAPGCTFPAYTRPQYANMPGDMMYVPWQPTGSGRWWGNYGNPGGAGNPYNYLLWNMPTRDGPGTTDDLWESEVDAGGLVMATLKNHTRVLGCDVSHQILTSFQLGSWRPNGWTDWAYVQVTNGAETLHGWFLTRYCYGSSATSCTVTNLFSWT